MQLTLPFIGLIILTVWLSIVSVVLWKNYYSGKKLLEGEYEMLSPATIKKIAHEIEGDKKDIQDIISRITHLENDTATHFQKVGLTRFNPFRDTGGEQSFILALTDKRKTGIVISGLFTRSGTRWYAKKIVEGKGVDVTLSEEEQKAVAEAK